MNALSTSKSAARTGVTSPSEVPSNPQQLVQSAQGLVRSIAWKIKQNLPPHVEMEDLIGYGQVGLVEAATDFDTTKGTQFTTFAYYRIRGAILDGLSQMAWFNRADFHGRRYDRMAGELLKAEQGEEQPQSQGNAKTNSTEGEAGWFANMAVKLSVVYLVAGSGKADDEAGLVDSAPPPDAGMMSRELQEWVRRKVEELPPPAQALIKSAYFEGTTLQEAGRRLGISKAWASRLHARAVAQLSRSMNRAGFVPS